MDLGVFDLIRAVMVNLATITCDKCGRTWHAPLKKWVINGELKLAPTVRTVAQCSQCRRLIFIDGRDQDGFDGGPARLDEKLSDLALKSWDLCEQERRNRESREREEIMTPGWIRERASPEKIRWAYWLLTHAPRARLVRMFPELSEYDVRAGKTERLFALMEAAGVKPADKEKIL